jgi:hypothetical protein
VLSLLALLAQKYLPEDYRQPGTVRPSFLTGLTGVTGVIVTEHRPNGHVISVSYNVLED